LLLIPQGANKFAISLPKCVQALFERVYEGESTFESSLNDPELDTDITCDEWCGGLEYPSLTSIGNPEDTVSDGGNDSDEKAGDPVLEFDCDRTSDGPYSNLCLLTLPW
jgi:hypothetical protein